MKLEAVSMTVRYRWPGGEVRLEPGTPIELPDARARRLLEKAAGKVRAVPFATIPTVQPGSQVSWDSPLFGRLTGTVTAVWLDGFVEVHHPLTKELTTIPLSWVVQGEAAP